MNYPNVVNVSNAERKSELVSIASSVGMVFKMKRYTDKYGKKHIPKKSKCVRVEKHIIKLPQNVKFVDINGNPVKFKVQKNESGTYYIYKADTLEEAKDILRQINNIPSRVYHVVETPHCNYCKDKLGYYQEPNANNLGIGEIFLDRTI